MIALWSWFHKCGHIFTEGHGASSDSGLHISNHLVSRQNCARSNLSLNTNDASVTVPFCLAPHVVVNYQPPLTIPQTGFRPNSGSDVGNTSFQVLMSRFVLMHTVPQTVAPSVPQVSSFLVCSPT